MFEKLKRAGFDVLMLHHAEAILKHDMASAADEIESVLVNANAPVEELVRGGGGEGSLPRDCVGRWLNLVGKSITLRSRKRLMVWKKNQFLMKLTM